MPAQAIHRLLKRIRPPTRSGAKHGAHSQHTRPLLLGILLSTMLPLTAIPREIHVSPHGDDHQSGSLTQPYRTISAAAEVANPGDVITVHEGTYRERVTPPRGGDSDARRIIYQAAAGEKVEIKGSEVIKSWVRVQEDVWKVTLPNAFFGKFNPYRDLIHGDWFEPRGRLHHTGAVYLDGEWLPEAAKVEEVLTSPKSKPSWFATVDELNTTILARFPRIDPNQALVEINVRQTVFYPARPHVNYVTVQGFAMRHAATPWAPPTAEQIGLIGTHWSKGWIIENNVITHSKCSGIALGKYGDAWDNQSANSAEGYVKTIERASQNGWNKETIGCHIVRNNTIAFCEQAGVVGSLGAVFSQITSNTIHDIHVQRLFTGAEMAGIKIHAAIDVQIRGNHIYRTCRGLWLDWMAQGTRVSGNLFHDNAYEDLFVEVNHGPFLVDNNIFLSPLTLNSRSQGGAYVHNLMAGEIHPNNFDDRLTPFHPAHSTEVAGMHNNPCGDDRYYNNIFVQRGDLSKYDRAALPVAMDGNLFLKGARPSSHEKGPISQLATDPALKLIEKPDGAYLELTLAPSWSTGTTRPMVTTSLLGKARIPNLPFENPDGSSLKIDHDYFGRERSGTNPTVGPFESPGHGQLSLKVSR